MKAPTKSSEGQGAMDGLNTRLYLQNFYIMKENERLRKKAELLNQENQALLSELKKKLLARPETLPGLNTAPNKAPSGSKS